MSLYKNITLIWIVLSFLTVYALYLISELSSSLADIRWICDEFRQDISEIKIKCEQMGTEIKKNYIDPKEYEKRTKNYSMTWVYDENGEIGHEWTYKHEQEDDHWITVTYNNKTEKFIVKHLRSDHLFTSYVSKILEDIEYNKINVYGNGEKSSVGAEYIKKNGILIAPHQKET